MSYYGYGPSAPYTAYPGYYGAPYSVGGYRWGYALIVVLLILLIIFGGNYYYNNIYRK